MLFLSCNSLTTGFSADCFEAAQDVIMNPTFSLDGVALSYSTRVTTSAYTLVSAFDDVRSALRMLLEPSPTDIGLQCVHPLLFIFDSFFPPLWFIISLCASFQLLCVLFGSQSLLSVFCDVLRCVDHHSSVALTLFFGLLPLFLALSSLRLTGIQLGLVQNLAAPSAPPCQPSTPPGAPSSHTSSQKSQKSSRIHVEILCVRWRRHGARPQQRRSLRLSHYGSLPPRCLRSPRRLPLSLPQLRKGVCFRLRCYQLVRPLVCK